MGSKYVITDPVDFEDGTLYWSNEDSWGFLSTATAFAESEIDSNLPFDEDSRWVALPEEKVI